MIAFIFTSSMFTPLHSVGATPVSGVPPRPVAESESERLFGLHVAISYLLSLFLLIFLLPLVLWKWQLNPDGVLEEVDVDAVSPVICPFPRAPPNLPS